MNPDADKAIDRARTAYLRACELDIAVRKPGNVSLASPGHGMQAQQFIDSARASADPLFARGARVGERIEAATEATWAVAGCNTNLGIVLLCAPVAAAVERFPLATSALEVRLAIESVLADLDVADARAAYRAIARANPGGLGSAPREDVRSEPTVTLREAMALAADRDQIGLLYRDGYASLFDIGVAALGDDFHWPEAQPSPRLADGGVALPTARIGRAVLRCYLALLGQAPDSHIVRKRGATVAHTVMDTAARWGSDARLIPVGSGLEVDPAFVEWDESLKTDGLNPGTTADLTVASMLLASIAQPLSSG
ncbi:MAG: triphosphoribosyl-dephospho-CoA synthase [Burkholderiaceae bacterium]|nr:triphosphoribosyl-dephospho-CoA synthase [Burkholderiaceae bacterium]